MASNSVKGLTVEIGGDTTQLGKALDGVNKKSRELSGELGQINKLLKMDPGNADLLAQKQKVLADAVNNTAKKLELLEEAERQVQEQFKRGEVSEEQVRALQREIIDTTQRLDKYKQAARETADAVDQLGDESRDTSKKLDDVGDSADEAEKESDDLGSTMEGSLSTGFSAVIALATAASAAIVGCVEASQEYRTAMGKLNTSFEASGHTGEVAKETYKELQSVLGDTDQAVEASNHLAKLADNEEELTRLTDALAGVYATFGDSLPIEGLAEAANETAKTGQVTGSFADAINWATDETTDWNKIMGKNRTALHVFNKAVKNGEKTEDAFTAALESCSDEQERQQLITQTLTELYTAAGDQYKITNKQVIEANKANEEWSATMAELGEDLSPVVVEVKKFGTELLKNAKDPLKDVGSFITDKVLPALASLGDWVRNNIPTIKAGLAGVAAAMVTYKAATIAAEIAHNGLKGAIMATTVAQNALNLAQKATPWGLAAMAIGAVVTGLAVYAATTEDATEKVDALTEEERELMEAADETAQAFRDQKTATEENVAGISSQMGHVQDLADELQTLADASGKVKETDQARADFIIHELNDALGKEYEMVDGVIQGYADLKKNIDEVILSKTANAMLEANNTLYVEALQTENQALQDLALSEKDYQQQLEYTQTKEQEYTDLLARLDEAKKNLHTGQDQRALQSLGLQVNAAHEAWMEEQGILDEKKDAFDAAAANYGNYSDIIANYEEAQTAAMNGNYDRTIEVLKGKSGSFGDYADDVDEATREAIDALYKEAIDAGIEADRTRKNFEKGVDGYTEEMVKEAEQGYEDALNEWATARADAESVGEDLSSGLSGGMENQRSSLISKARSIVQSIIGAIRDESETHSPSRKMMAVGEDLGEGAEIGLESTTPDILKTARKQVQRLVATYQDEGTPSSQTALRSVAERAQTRSTENFQGFISGNNSKLNEILAAIKAGQVIMLDGDLLVGGTANQMNNRLGQLQLLTERGAI